MISTKIKNINDILNNKKIHRNVLGHKNLSKSKLIVNESTTVNNIYKHETIIIERLPKFNFIPLDEQKVYLHFEALNGLKKESIYKAHRFTYISNYIVINDKKADKALADELLINLNMLKLVNVQLETLNEPLNCVFIHPGTLKPNGISEAFFQLLDSDVQKMTIIIEKHFLKNTNIEILRKYFNKGWNFYFSERNMLLSKEQHNLFSTINANKNFDFDKGELLTLSKIESKRIFGSNKNYLIAFSGYTNYANILLNSVPGAILFQSNMKKESELRKNFNHKVIQNLDFSKVKIASLLETIARNHEDFFNYKNESAVFKNFYSNKGLNSSEETITKINDFYGSSKYKLLSVGRISEEKNHIFLIELMKKNRHEDMKLVICGHDGGKLELIEKLIKENSLENEILLLTNEKFIGNNIYKIATHLVHPSLYEGLPLVFYEALWNKMRIISNNDLECKNEFKENILFSKLTTDDFTKAIKGDCKLSEFNFDKYNDKTLKAFENVLPQGVQND